MKTTALATLAALLLCLTAFAHEPITIGPNGGRVATLDSAAVPNAEFNVVGDHFVVTLLDKGLRPIPTAEHVLTITAGDRNSPQKLAVERQPAAFRAVKPKGDDYWVILQLRETAKSKPLTFRVHYQTATCAECRKPEWICICGNDPKR